MSERPYKYLLGISSSKYPGDEIFVPETSDFNFTDFCIECRFRLDSNGSKTRPHIWQFNQGSLQARFNLWIENRTNLVLFWQNGAPTSKVFDIAGINEDQWYAVAVDYNSGTARIFIDGVLSGTAVSSFPTGNASLSIGQQHYTPLAADKFEGWIDEFRVTVASRYTATYIPEEAEFPENSTDDPQWDDVKLLLHMNGDDGSKSFPDATGKRVFTIGSPSVDTAQKVFGTASALFPVAS
jgi:hypothetical protein